MPTKSDAAALVDWMVARLASEGCLYQHEVIDELHQRSLSDLITESSDGGEGVPKEILAAFRKRTPDVIWARSELMWRMRTETDAPGRMQD